MKTETGKKGGKKIGRNMRKPSCARYTREVRWIKNKLRDLKKHVKGHPNDLCAKLAVIRIKEENYG